MRLQLVGGCAVCAGADQRQWPGRQSQTCPLCLVWLGVQTAPGCAGLAQCPSTQTHEPERTTYCPPIQTWNLLGGAGRATITTGGGGGAQPISTSATSTGTESLETTMQPDRRTAAQRQATSKRYFRLLIIHCSLLTRRMADRQNQTQQLLVTRPGQLTTYLYLSSS